MAFPRNTSLNQIVDAYGDNVEAGLRGIFIDGDAISTISISDEEQNPSVIESDLNPEPNDDDDNASTTSTIEYLPHGTFEDIEKYFINPKEYVRYLRSCEREIDKFLSDKERKDPSEDMLRYSEYPWHYDTLPSARRNRLTCIRYHCEKYNRKMKEAAKEEVWGSVESHEGRAENKKPVCSICYHDLRSDFHIYRRLYSLKCGHISHRFCVKKLYFEHNSKRCPCCNVESEFRDIRNIRFT